MLQLNNRSFIQAKDIEDKFEQDYKDCKQAFINCSKLEDAALEYMIKCYTSASTIKANVVELTKIQDSCEKLQTALTAVVTSSGGTTASGRREKRQKNSESVTCATYITQFTTLNIVSIFYKQTYRL